jgi:hypothetical protein
MSLPPKELRCSCGHTFVSDKNKTWCNQCMQPVFYNSKDQRANRLNNYYTCAAVVLVMGFLTYLFIELIMGPFLQ